LKPDPWGSPVFHGKYQEWINDKRQQNYNNNNLVRSRLIDC
jgi:hypothetical protein